MLEIINSNMMSYDYSCWENDVDVIRERKTWLSIESIFQLNRISLSRI